MRRAACVAALAFLIVFIGVPAFAQATLKIAVVDTDKAFKESIWGKKAIEELEKEAETWQKQGEQLDKEIAQLEEKLAKQRSFLDEAEEEKKLENEIVSKRMEGRAFFQEGNEVLAEKRQQLLEPILEMTKDVIKKLSMAEAYDIVLEKQLFVLYLNPELEITNQVIAMLDKAYRERTPDEAKGTEEESAE